MANSTSKSGQGASKSSAKKSSVKKSGASPAGASKKASKKGSQKRELIAPNDDKRYIKRNEKGQIKESDDQGKSLSQDVKQTAKTKVKPGFGDQGDQPSKPAAKKAPAKKAPAKKTPAKKTPAKKAPAKKSAKKSS